MSVIAEPKYDDIYRTTEEESLEVDLRRLRKFLPCLEELICMICTPKKHRESSERVYSEDMDTAPFPWWSDGHSKYVTLISQQPDSRRTRFTLTKEMIEEVLNKMEWKSTVKMILDERQDTPHSLFGSVFGRQKQSRLRQCLR